MVKEDTENYQSIIALHLVDSKKNELPSRQEASYTEAELTQRMVIVKAVTDMIREDLSHSLPYDMVARVVRKNPTPDMYTLDVEDDIEVAKAATEIFEKHFKILHLEAETA